MKKLRICFISPDAYPLLTGKKGAIFGGAELQLSILGKQLAKRGHDITFLTYDYNNGKEEITKEGIRIIPLTRRTEDRSLKTVISFSKALWKGMKKANADIYHLRGIGSISGLCALFAHIMRKKFVFNTAMLADCDGTTIKEEGFLAGNIFKYGIKRADKIFVQTVDQKRALKKTFNRDGIIIRNSIDPELLNRKHKRKKKQVLWVSMISERKRPLLLLDVAEKMPETKFVMAGGTNKYSKNLVKKIRKRAKKLKNVNILGLVPYPNSEDLFKESMLFVNTSYPNKEGFPNSFLQAWNNGVPTISFIDPDGVIEKNKMGVHVSNEAELISAVKRIIKDKTQRKKMGRAAKEYINKYHNPDKILKQYLKEYYRLVSQ